jgi:hypothetical protein
MTTVLTLTTAGVDSGPFDLYSNLDGFVTPFETGVSKATLVAGYTTTLVPNYTTTVRVKSTGICLTYTDIDLSLNYYSFVLEDGVDCPEACANSKTKIFI